MEESETEGAASLRLGNILYSNCFPVHARLIDRPRQGDPVLVDGIPSRLNDLLESGRIDVAPSSSIEFARHADRYSVFPDLVIGARGAVRSILFLGLRHPSALDGAVVAVPSASATSVVLLKALLRERWRARPRFFWFDQAREDPFARGADAALFIGDVALRTDLHAAARHRFDLGEEWRDETGLPFAFAVWQASVADGAKLRELHGLLMESRRYGLENREALAERHASRFGLDASMLADYWGSLSYEFDAPMRSGLQAFFEMAVAAGELARAPDLRWI